MNSVNTENWLMRTESWLWMMKASKIRGQADGRKHLTIIQLPQDIKQVMEFWRRNYGETEPIELNDNVIDAGVECEEGNLD